MGRRSLSLSVLAVSITLAAALSPHAANGGRRFPTPRAGSYVGYNHAFGVPTYNWGYFGAVYRPQTVSHRGYYDRFKQWSYRPGY